VDWACRINGTDEKCIDILTENTKDRKQLEERVRLIQKHNHEMDFCFKDVMKRTGFYWLLLDSCEHNNEPSDSLKFGEFLNHQSDYHYHQHYHHHLWQNSPF
jgi:hypothetical protein